MGGDTSAQAAYDAIVGALAQPAMEAQVSALRRERESRTGTVDGDDEGFEARMLAFWDAAVTTSSLLSEAKSALPDDVARWIPRFERAHRGLFQLEATSPSGITVTDRWSGAAFVITPRPPRALAMGLESGEGLCDGRLVGALEGDVPSITLLPGALFHPPDATTAIESVLEAARRDQLSRDDALDALLRMEARLRSHSRVKPSYAYRAESLRR